MKQNGHVFCVGNKSFVHFDDLSDFEVWYSNMLNPYTRSISEVIRSDMRKLILDIDSPKSCDMLEKLSMYDFERHVTARIHETFFLLDIGVPDVVVYSMCSDGVISYHIVVSNIMFSARTCLGLCAIISSGQPWECCVDRGVYKSVQFIRVEGSTKPNECRWKQRLDKGPLRQGILSDPFGTTVSGFTAAAHSTGYACSVSDTVQGYNCYQFRIGRVIPSLRITHLYRKRPGFCYQCDRIHDRENAFIKYCDGVPVFTCWRYISSA